MCDDQCKGCNAVPCQFRSGGVSAQGKVVMVDVTTAALLPIGLNGWSTPTDVPPGQVQPGYCFVTLDASKGSSLVLCGHKDGLSVLQHGVPCYVQGPITVAVSAADRTSLVCLLVSSQPVRLSPATFREVGKVVTASAGALTPATATAANSFLVQPSASDLVVQVLALAAASDVTLQELVDPNGSVRAFQGSTTVAASAGVPISDSPTLPHAAHVVWAAQTAGPTTVAVRVFQPLGGA